MTNAQQYECNGRQNTHKRPLGRETSTTSVITTTDIEKNILVTPIIKSEAASIGIPCRGRTSPHN